MVRDHAAAQTGNQKPRWLRPRESGQARKDEEQMNYQMYFDSHPCSKQHREEAPKETQKLTTMTFSRAHVNTEAAKEEG
jgi:hypothetical protein